jgi:hypothetical protein
MNDITNENSLLVGQLAKTAHEMVDRMADRAVKMEGELGKHSKETSEQLVARIDRQVSGLESFIAGNPAAAAAIAFGLGAFGTRIFKSIDLTPSAATPVESTPSEEKPKAKVKKAA